MNEAARMLLEYKDFACFCKSHTDVKTTLCDVVQAEWQQMTVPEHVAWYEKQGISHKEAMKLAAKDRGVGKSEIYKALLGE